MEAETEKQEEQLCARKRETRPEREEREHDTDWFSDKFWWSCIHNKNKTAGRILLWLFVCLKNFSLNYTWIQSTYTDTHARMRIREPFKKVLRTLLDDTWIDISNIHMCVVIGWNLFQLDPLSSFDRKKALTVDKTPLKSSRTLSIDSALLRSKLDNGLDWFVSSFWSKTGPFNEPTHRWLLVDRYVLSLCKSIFINHIQLQRKMPHSWNYVTM